MLTGFSPLHRATSTVPNAQPSRERQKRLPIFDEESHPFLKQRCLVLHRVLGTQKRARSVTYPLAAQNQPWVTMTKLQCKTS